MGFQATLNEIARLYTGLSINIAEMIFADAVTADKRLVGYQSNVNNPNRVLDEAAAIAAYIASNLPAARLRNILRTSGIAANDLDDALGTFFIMDNFVLKPDLERISKQYSAWTTSLLHQFPLPTIEQALLLLNRKLINDGAFDWILEHQGYKDGLLRDAYKELRWEIPGSSDLIRFAVREAFTPELVQKFGYAKEFPREILPWMEKQGYGQPTGIPRPPGSTDNTGRPMVGIATWSDLFWWSHWELVSVTQASEMFFRLYTTSRYGPSPYLRLSPPFEQADFDDLLKALDYPTYWRRRLQATLYRPITRVDVRRMHAIGILGPAEVYHAYRAQGYDDINADALTRFTIKLNEPKEAKELKVYTEQKICSLYTDGIITTKQATDLYVSLGFKPERIAQLAAKCQLEAKQRLVRESVRYIREGFLTGEIDEDATRAALIRLGLTLEKINEYLDLWLLLLRYKYKRPNTEMLIQWYLDGIIDEREFIMRLFHLKYTQAAVSRIVRFANLKAQKAIAREQRRIVREQQQAQNKAATEASRIQATVLRNRERALAKALSASSEKNIKTWLQAKLITPQDAYARFRSKGWTRVDALNWLRVTIGEINAEDIKDAIPQTSQEP